MNKENIDEWLTVEWLDDFALRIINLEGEVFYLTPKNLNAVNEYYASAIAEEKRNKNVSRT